MAKQELSGWELEELAAFMAALDDENGVEWDESPARSVCLSDLQETCVTFNYSIVEWEQNEEKNGGKSKSTLYRKRVPMSLLTDPRFSLKERLRFSGDWQAVEHETKVVIKVAGTDGEERCHTTIERWQEPEAAHS